MQLEVHAAKETVTNLNAFKNKVVKNEGCGGEGKCTKF